MDLLYSRQMRSISAIILFFFVWSFGGGFDIAAFAATSNQKVKANNPQSKTSKPEEKFQKAIENLYETLADPAKDTDTKKNKAKSKKAEIEALDVDIKKQFAETEKTLKDKGLPPEIHERHRKFVQHYEENLSELTTNLNNIEKAKTKAAADAEIEKTKSQLEKVKAPKKYRPLDPNKLPHRTPEEKRVVLEEYVPSPKRQMRPDLQKLIGDRNEPLLQVAANGSLKGLLSGTSKYAHDAVGFDKLSSSSSLPVGSYQIALASPPSAEDLAENGIEILFTPAIVAKAAELGGSGTGKALKIYNWVRNNIEYVPTYGSIQGADMCLQTKQCNDTDTASLLISLYRASGIYAHYRTVSALIPIEKVQNLLGGFTDRMAALNLLASAGIPVKGFTEAGQIKYAQIERTVVEAFIDYIPSRGEIHRQGDTWILLDPAFKQFKYTPGIDIKSAVPFDAQSFIDKIKATATINETAGYVTNVNSALVQQTMSDYQTQVQNYISQTHPNATVGDVLGKKEIIQQNFPYLLGTLPYKPLSKGTSYSSLPDNLRHKITFNVIKDIYDEYTGTPLNITKSLPELAGKKITLSYSPATSADEAVINSYLPKPHADGSPIQPSELPTSLPAYLINVKPELRIDGGVVATGTTVGLGANETLQLVFSAPSIGSDQATHMIKAGEYVGIVINPSMISSDQMTKLKTKLEETKTKLESQDLTGLSKDDIMGDLLFATASLYYAELDARDYILAKRMGLVNLRLPSEGAFSLQLNASYIFGIPQSVSVGGAVMDVVRNLNILKSLDGNNSQKIQFMILSGVSSSALEHSVPEKMFSSPEKPAQGISAVKALKLASDQGIPIYTINQSNINTILPQLQVDADVRADIQNAINAGKIVTVAKTNIVFNGWVGCGYIIIDPRTGNGAYMISGGLSGGWTICEVLVLTLLIVLAGIGGSVAIALIVAALAIYGPVILVFWIPLLLWAYYMCQFELSPSSPPDEYTLLCAIVLTIVAAGV